jgi:DNA gyrase subunit A
VVDDRNGEVVGSVQVHDTDRVMLITNTGRVIKIGVDGIRETKSRAAKGVTLMRVEKGEKIVAVTRVVDNEEDEPGEEDTPTEDTPTEGAPKGEE